MKSPFLRSFKPVLLGILFTRESIGLLSLELGSSIRLSHGERKRFCGLKRMDMSILSSKIIKYFTTIHRLYYNLIMEIYTKLEQIMVEKGITDSSLSDATGLTKMTIRNARQGKNVTLKTARTISKEIKKPIEEVWPFLKEEAAA